MHLNACAFDLGNTLVNDSELHSRALADLSGWLSRRASISSRPALIDAYREVVHSDTLPFQSHTFGELSYFEKTFRLMGVENVSSSEALQVYRRYVMKRTRRDGTVVRAFRFLKSRGIKTALISNESSKRVEAYLNETRSGDLFDAIVVSQNAGTEKPRPEIFQIALKRLGVQASQTAMFGDNEVADGACKELGMLFVQVIGYKDEHWQWEEGTSFRPDYVLQRVTARSLRKLLREVERVRTQKGP
jgi:putative hydrolase of the HAD superfamily